MTDTPCVASQVTEAAFRQRMTDLGCPELREVAWTAEHSPALHHHDFDAHGLVLAGEFTLIGPHGDCLLRPGDQFALSAGILHTERAGPAGTRLLAARLPPRQTTG